MFWTKILNGNFSSPELFFSEALSSSFVEYDKTKLGQTEIYWEFGVIREFFQRYSEVITSVMATIIGVCALVITIYQAAVTRENQ